MHFGGGLVRLVARAFARWIRLSPHLTGTILGKWNHSPDRTSDLPRIERTLLFGWHPRECGRGLESASPSPFATSGAPPFRPTGVGGEEKAFYAPVWEGFMNGGAQSIQSIRANLECHSGRVYQAQENM